MIAANIDDRETILEIIKVIRKVIITTRNTRQSIRAIIAAQPGSTKAVNEFLRNPQVVNAMYSGNDYNFD